MNQVSDRRAVPSRWWAVALVAVALACCVVTAIEFASGAGSALDVALVVAGVIAYVLFFALVTRPAAEGSARAWASVVVTVTAAGALTAVEAGNALFQFWMYPLIWVLTATIPAAVITSAVAAVVVFAGFAVSMGSDPEWAADAALTQAISFGVSVVLGLWITNIYQYAEERERLLAELTAAQDEVAALHRHAGVTSERERLSRELHDTIAQSLAGTVLLAQRARREAAGGGAVDDTLALLEESARSALAETRALVAGNAPIELRGGGVIDALQALADRFARETGTHVDVDAAVAIPLDRESEVALLRCAQEALANVRAHAGARSVRLSLRAGEGWAELRVRDDGRGFDPDAPSAGFGLSGLRARVGLLGGDLVVDGTPGATTLLARVPAGASA
ncbi:MULTISPECIES: sensor histidine kinase [Microbacterium]|uniref:Sensor histidine kinase n=1 Tax=Microbacterium wangchenii TaxID=2541726 RepID=A0ABX5SVP4_9MICO|nr:MULTISPECIES: sensor histidine kinase [Microbacterium]MCK6065924.1 sensor histidine kinase [Microbacterium sp. EYE_512]QBR90224.1 sensor histidine kinase [Microbacterium wangchenii]TXK11761.1 sensor histidine kinase [Microbacterium wangchenii]